MSDSAGKKLDFSAQIGIENTATFYRTAFMTTGLDRTYHAHRFIFSFTF